MGVRLDASWGLYREMLAGMRGKENVGDVPTGLGRTRDPPPISLCHHCWGHLRPFSSSSVEGYAVLLPRWAGPLALSWTAPLSQEGGLQLPHMLLDPLRLPRAKGYKCLYKSRAKGICILSPCNL